MTRPTRWPDRDEAIAVAQRLVASDVEGLRLVLASTLGDRYEIRVAEDGSTVWLRRR